MRSGLVLLRKPMAEPEPPQPTPFPIRIVTDPPSRDSDDDGPAVARQSGARNDNFYKAWDKFLAIQPKRGKKMSRPARAVAEEQAEVEKSDGKEGIQVEENAAISLEQATEQCKAKVKAIVDECRRLNQKYRDAMFDLEGQDNWCLESLHGQYPKALDKINPPPWIKRVEDIFDNPQFFIDGATAQDVHQGSSGDCWFLAALMAVSAKKELIERLCVARDEKAGVYGFVFYRDGEWIYEVIDDKLYLRVGDDDDITVVRDWDKDKKEGMPLKHDGEKLLSSLQRGGEALYFSHCKSSETWLPLIEKAYAKAHGDYFAIEGGFASEAIEDLTGGVGVVINPEDIMDKERFWREQLSQVNEKYLFGGGSKPVASKGFVGSHAYAVLKTFEEGDLKLLKLRNPWGEVEWSGDYSDGSKLWTPELMKKLDHTFGDDGVFWIDYKSFLKHFPSINRVRLFNDEWQVAQQWTSVNVPWTVDYLDTKFSFTIDKKCPVVIVLSQPDDRYFYGLRGRFLHSMHFRVYKEGEEGRWIVRSMHNSGAETVYTRSVSAEIEDLEPGTYNVVFKVTAVRATVGMTAEEAVMKYAVDRKEKLLAVGRRFDYAQTKGNLRGMEEANERRKAEEKKEDRKGRYKNAREVNRMERERARRRKRRVDEAMREKKRDKRKAKEEARRSKRGDVGEGRSNGDTPTSTESPSKPSDTKSGAEEEPAVSDSTSADAPKPADGSSKASEQAENDKVKQKEDDQSDRPKDDAIKAADSLSKDLAKLDISTASGSSSSKSPAVSPLGDGDNGDSSSDDPDELEDDDFEWDSDMDGPVELTDDFPNHLSRRSSSSSSSSNIFGDDPWNAIAVLGLRVYAHNANVKVKVVKGEGDS